MSVSLISNCSIASPPLSMYVPGIMHDLVTDTLLQQLLQSQLYLAGKLWSWNWLQSVPVNILFTHALVYRGVVHVEKKLLMAIGQQNEDFCGILFPCFSISRCSSFIYQAHRRQANVVLMEKDCISKKQSPFGPLPFPSLVGCLCLAYFKIIFLTK